MIPRVIAALRLSGGLKAGTPLEMASVPVMAVQPAGERAQDQIDEGEALDSLRRRCRRAAAACKVPVSQRTIPTTTRPPAMHDEERTWGRRTSCPILEARAGWPEPRGPPRPRR